MFRFSVSPTPVRVALPLQWLEAHDPVRNHIGWRQRLASFGGSHVDLDLRAYDEPLAEITLLADEIQRVSDEEIDARVRAIRDEVRRGGSVDRLRAPFFALAREVSSRVIGMRPFDVQVVAALALDRGAIVEMQTGEGKTLAAVMPVAFRALAGQGVHVLTFNDYLARRDAEWMGPVYNRLGLSVGFVQHEMTSEDRRGAYRADVTYVTAKEAGFDHLRDLLARDLRDVVHRPFHFALVDEADSLLIDEARVPLVIAGSVVHEESSAARLAGIVAAFTPGIHFDLDEYGRNAALTDAGIEYVERRLACGSLHEEKNYALLSELNCALHAHALLRRDVDYLVRDGRIGIIDELTGRVVADRHWPDGLQAALEAKERIDRQPDGRILGSMTLQHFLRGYPGLCGMTGTAQTAAAELHDMYGLGVVVVPTHRAMIRIDRADVVFSHRDAKERAVVEEIRRVHASGRPVLVGTLTVAESERLAGRLREAGVACQVLNAKNDASEARIVAAAGAPGAVTISTNMAGRGTDIRLGGVDERAREQVVALGGLYVIGTNRHESLRIDLQLRGRAGRQGDPGESRFFISLEDDLLVRYGIQNLLAGRFVNDNPADPIDDATVFHEVARAQRIVEGQNVEIRKTLWRYAAALERQRLTIMQWRQLSLEDPESLDVWQRSPDARAALVTAAGEEAVRHAEQAVTLHHIDRAWCDHLALAADLREGIHLVSLGGQDPLARFTSEITLAFQRLHETIEERVLDALRDVRVANATIDLAQLDIKGPSSTWTYLVNDEPFRNQIGMLLTGPGRATFAIGAALFAMPLLMLWGVVDRYLGRRPARGRDASGR
jgi:preprotein translocase subunit SecA